MEVKGLLNDALLLVEWLKRNNLNGCLISNGDETYISGSREQIVQLFMMRTQGAVLNLANSQR